MKLRRLVWLSLMLLALSLSAVFVQAIEIESDVPPAEIVNDEGGPVLVQGVLPITNVFVKSFGVQPLILLEDQAGFVDRNVDFSLSPESQVIATFTTDFYAPDPVGYQISLPIVPQGSYRDVDLDGNDSDLGVQIYQVGYWDNEDNIVQLNEREVRGWSTAYSSAQTSILPETLGEIIGGNLLVYAPDDQQGFPSGFGPDGLLFTADDPLVLLPQGYTAVNLDSETFTFDRSREVTFDLLEPPSSVFEDFSDLSYTEAFDALIETGRNEYSFTEYKDVDWDALSAQFRPIIEQAQADGDTDAYLIALRDLYASIPDGHLFFNSAHTVFNGQFQQVIAGGLGFAVEELSDGRIVVDFLTADGPAEAAGIQLGARISEINGTPMQEHIDNVDLDFFYSFGNFSNDTSERVQRLRYGLRFPLDSEVELTYRNPDDIEPQTIMLTVVAEQESFASSSINAGIDNRLLPINFEILDSGYGYVQMTSFNGRQELMINIWEYFLEQAANSPAIIIDLRNNGGGSSAIGYEMASYLFEEETDIGYTESYNEDIDAFFYDERFPITIEPRDADERYNGEIIVLVGNACASACETFANALTYLPGVEFVGHRNTRGLGGGWLPLSMPEGVTLTLTRSRHITLDGDIAFEGPGIEPTVLVPITEQSLFYNGDFLVDFAVDYLDEALSAEVESGAEVVLGEATSGSIDVGVRTSHRFVVPADGVYDIIVSDLDGSGQLDTVLRVYNEAGTLVGENDDFEAGSILTSGFAGVQLGANEVYILEVGGFEDDVTGEYEITVTESGE